MSVQENGQKFKEVVIRMPVEDEAASALVVELRGLAADLREHLQAVKQSAAPLSYSEAEAACELEMSEVTLARLRRDGKISYTRVAGKARYTRAQIEDYLNAAQTVRAGKKGLK